MTEKDKTVTGIMAMNTKVGNLMRKGEVMALKWENVEFEERKI